MTRNIESLKPHELKKAVMFFRIETVIIIVISFMINLAIIGAFTILNTDNLVESQFDFIQAAYLIKDNVGSTCMYFYAIGLFASGMSATATGALCGQYVMNGYYRMNVNKNVRIIVTRLIALAPCLCVVWFAQVDSANLIINLIQAIQLPFVMIPLVRYIKSKRIMKGLSYGGGCRFYLILITT